MPIRDTPGPRCVPVTSRRGPERRRRRKGRPPACGVCPFSSPSCVFSFSFSSSPFWLSCRSPSCRVRVKLAMSLQPLPLPKNPSQTLPPGTPPAGPPGKGDACREKKGFWGQSRGFWGWIPRALGILGWHWDVPSPHRFSSAFSSLSCFLLEPDASGLPGTFWCWRLGRKKGGESPQACPKL